MVSREAMLPSATTDDIPSDSDDEEDIEHDMDNPFDIRGGIGADQLLALAAELGLEGPPQLADSADRARLPVAIGSDESTDDRSGVEGGEDGDNDSIDEEDIEHDMDEPFHVGGGVPNDRRGLVPSATVVAGAAVFTAYPQRQIGPLLPNRRRLEVELKPLTAKNLGLVLKLHAVGSAQGRGGAFYDQAISAADYTRAGYSNSALVCAVCCRCKAGPDGGSSLHIESLDVLRAYRRRRIASQLLASVLRQAMRPCWEGGPAAVEEVFAVVPAANTAAMALFRDAFGFEVVEECELQGEVSCRLVFQTRPEA